MQNASSFVNRLIGRHRNYESIILNFKDKAPARPQLRGLGAPADPGSRLLAPAGALLPSLELREGEN
ncbi:hypothetical protein B9Z55_008953 [Caenorhabditis nigoni]|uniref:Uncharacterized protein n=1 Tax=Caenorhabditis nigoni TaxID=1611254 RepID=A0A2G5UPU8_9PELO|nr:hypothetical protein B9Z55_008953 [Caenorhabditis nigoni]